MLDHQREILEKTIKQSLTISIIPIVILGNYKEKTINNNKQLNGL